MSYIDERILLAALVGLQFMTALAVLFVGYAVICLRKGLAHLEPVVVQPRPTGNPTIKLYDTVAYFIEWCQANDHTGEIKFSELWVLYQKYCLMRDISDAEQLTQNPFAARLNQLLGEAKTISKPGSNSSRQRVKVYTVPHPFDYAFESESVANANVDDSNVTNLTTPKLRVAA